MTEEMRSRQDLRTALAWVAAITLVRMFVLVVSPLELYPDEAQYWSWAQSPAFGYFSKPPMIAWIVWVTTRLLGDAEWAVRMSAPILHAAVSLFIFAIARRLFDARVALLSALAYLTTPGASYSSTLITTDVPLLLCWSAALYAFVRARDDTQWRWPILCGVALGLGLLSKYAMFYFLLGAIVSAILDDKSRSLVFSVRGLTILTIGLLLLAPNIFWNAQHGFPTLQHTETNAQWSRAHFNPASSLGFLAAQFGVIGPVLMAGFLGALLRLARKGEQNSGELLLAAFSLPPLALMLAQSFISTANANWAASAFVAAAPLAVRELRRWWNGRALWISFTVNGAAMLLLWIVVAMPQVGEGIGIGNAFKREEGWRTLGRQVVAQSAQGQYLAVVAVNRSMLAELLYYAHPSPVPIRSWSPNAHPRDHFQMTMPWKPSAGRVLLVLAPEEAKAITTKFDSVSRVESVVVPIGGHHQRVTQLYDARSYRGQ